MRAPAATVAVFGAACISVLGAAGCGGGSDSADSPLDNALGYLPADAPLVASIDTDVNGAQFDAIGKIVDRFSFGDAVKDAVKAVVEDEGGNYEDVKPLLGNEFVVGATDVASLTGDSGDGQDFVGAIQATSKGKLEKAVEADKAKKVGKQDGAQLYEDDDGDVFAITDDVLIVAGSTEQLKAAVKQRAADGRLTEEAFDKATAALPRDALLRVGGDLQKLLSDDPSTAEARKIKWVQALRTFGVTVSFTDDQATVGFRLNTDAGQITEADLPIAPGSASPLIADRSGEIVVGVRDPTQIIDFAEDAAQAIGPQGFADYAHAKRAIEKQVGLNIERDLLAQLEGDASITFAAGGKYGARAQVRDPAAFDRTLRKLGEVLPAIAEGVVGERVGYAKPKPGGNFYALSTAGGDSIVYGVVDRVFVLANDAKVAGRLASENIRSVADARGSVVVNANAAQLVQQVLGGTGLTSAVLTGPLGDLTGSMSAETTGITGNFKLKFK